MIHLSVHFREDVPALAKAADLLFRHARNFVFTADETADLILTLSLSDGMTAESFRLFGEGKEYILSAPDLGGLLCGVGHLLRRGKDGFREVEIVPAKPVRGIYFANHFFNFYHTAPLEEIRDYLEDLALWGCNVIEMWFDMHHFSSLRDPEAVGMLEKMKAVFGMAKELGMKTLLLTLANEYYAGGKPEWLAENSTEGTGYLRKLCGFYHTELCPSVPEARKALLDSKRELFGYFRDVPPDYVTLWPYDQGGCTCKKCFPWGSNGYWNLAKEEAESARAVFPGVKIVLSTWLFDSFLPDEWDRFAEKVKEDPSWFDVLTVEQTANARAHVEELRVPTIDFPEISMYGATPWGGFGANPFPNRLATRYDRVKDVLGGGVAYSEGFFEDVNKLILLQFYRTGNSDARTAVRDYVRYRFGDEGTDGIADLIFGLEETLPRDRMDGGVKCNYPTVIPTALPKFALSFPEKVRSLRVTADAIEKKLPESVKENKYWKILSLRARIDDELQKNGGIPNDETDRLCECLVTLYHGEKALYCVSPVTREAIMANRGKEMLL